MQKYDISQPIHLKKGIYELNRDPNFNYQLNRVINWDGGRLEDVAPIAAAFDKRISRVIAWSLFPCFLDVLISDENPAVQKMFHFLLKIKAKAIINTIFNTLAKKEPIIDWGLKHGMYTYEADSAYGYAQKLKLYDIAPIADKVTQDILIIGANQDHFINYKLIGQEINMFPNAKSLSFRLFTDKEEAQNHCNVGNGKLVLDTIDSWLDSLKKRDKKKSFFKERLIFYHSNTWQSMPNVRKASIASLTPLKAIFSAHSL